MKKLVFFLALLLFAPYSALAANTTPTGQIGGIQYNEGGGRIGTYALGAGLVATTSGGVTFLSSTSTGGVAPAGPDGAIQNNNSGSFGAYGIGTGLSVVGGNLVATFAPAGLSGSIQANIAGSLGSYTIGSGLSVVGGALVATATGGGSANPGGSAPQLQYNTGTNFGGLSAGTTAAYAAHDTVMNGLAYDPRNPAYGAVCGGSNTFSGDGSTKTFTYTIPFVNTTSTDTAGFFVFYEADGGFTNAVLLTAGTDYTVTGANSGVGGTITLASAPPVSTHLYVYHDDGPAFVAASAASVASGGYISVPNNCTIYTNQTNGTILSEGAQLVGQSFTPTYSFQGNQGTKPVLYVIAPFGASPNFGFNISSRNYQFFEGFTITSVLPVNNNGFLRVPVLIGATSAGAGAGGGGPGVVVQYMTFNYGKVGFGTAETVSNGNYIFATARFNNFAANDAGAYGPFSDGSWVNNNFAQNGAFGSIGTAGGLVFTLGSVNSNPAGSGATKVFGNRFEFNLEGVVSKGGFNISMDGNEFDNNIACGLDLRSTWGQITVTGGWFRANGAGQQPANQGNTAAGQDAHVCINGAGSGLHIANTQFLNGFGRGNPNPIGSNGANTPLYFLDVNTAGTGVSDIEINGADIQNSFTGTGAYVKDFSIYRNGQPTQTAVNVVGQAKQGELASGQNSSSARGLPTNAWSGYYAFGDVYNTEPSFIATAQYYPWILGSNMGMGPTIFALTNFSKDFDCELVDTQIVPNVHPDVGNNPLMTWLPSVVDPQFGAPSFYQAHEADTNTCRLGGLTWMAISQKFKTYAQSNACAATGFSSNAYYYGGAIGKTSTTNGDSLACGVTTYGNPAYIWYEMIGNSGGTFTYNVDGGTNSTVAVQGNNAFTFPVNAVGAIQALSKTTSGAGYVNGTYTSVPLVGGSGSGAQATIVVASTSVGSVSVTTAGTLYQGNDSLSVSSTALGGTGTGFAALVTDIGSHTLGAVRVPVQVSGTHTINIAVSSTTSAANPVTIMGVGISSNNPYVDGGPTVYLGGQIFDALNVTSTASAAYDVDLRTQANMLLADGLSVNFAPMRPYVNATTDMVGTGGSGNPNAMNAAGEGHIADAFAGVIQPLQNAAGYINPKKYGAACNAMYLGAQYINSPATQHLVSTTSGSSVISITNYTFQPGTANQYGGGGDVGKVISIYGNSDVGPTTYIASVSTSANTATVGGWPNGAATSRSDAGAIIGGFPSNPNDPSTAHDDTAALTLSSRAASGISAFLGSHTTSNTAGGKVFLPSNCLVHNFTPASYVTIEGSNGGAPYPTGNSGTLTALDPGASATNLWVASNMYPEDPAFGIDLTNTNGVRLKDFTIASPAFNFLPAGQMGACIGQRTGDNGGFQTEQKLLDHLAFLLCPVDYGIPFGMNQPVSFTASIAGNQLTVVSIDSTNFFDTYGVPVESVHADWLALNRTISGSGIISGTTIIGAPVTSHFNSPQTGVYTLSNSQTVGSESMVSPAPYAVAMGGASRNNFFGPGTFGFNGDMSDWQSNNDVFTGSIWYMGPAAGGSNASSRILGGRFEESQFTGGKVGAFTCDGCFDLSINGTQFQFGKNYAVLTKGSWGDIAMTNNLLQGNGIANASLDNAQIGLGGTGNDFQINGLTGNKNNFAFGGSSNYLVETLTGASVGYVDIEGNAVRNMYNVALANFAPGGIPSRYKQNAPGIANIDTTQPITVGGALSVSTTAGIGGANFYTNLSTTTTNTGTASITGLAPVNHTYDCSGGNGTTGIAFGKLLSGVTSTTGALAITTTVTSGDSVWFKCAEGN